MFVCLSVCRTKRVVLLARLLLLCAVGGCIAATPLTTWVFHMFLAVKNFTVREILNFMLAAGDHSWRR